MANFFNKVFNTDPFLLGIVTCGFAIMISLTILGISNIIDHFKK